MTVASTFRIGANGATAHQLDLQAIADRVAGGEKIRDIADDLIMSPGTLINRLREAKLMAQAKPKKESLPPEALAAIKSRVIAAYQSGQTVEIVGKAEGVAASTVYDWLQLWGVPSRPRGRKPGSFGKLLKLSNATLRRMRAKGLSDQAIADKFGVHRNSIFNRRKKAGID